MSEPKPSVVLDNGSGFVKVGFAGANFPTAVFPTAVGRPILRGGLSQRLQVNAQPIDSEVSDEAVPAPVYKELKETMIGSETAGVGHMLDMTFPVSNGLIQDMNDMKLLWDYAFFCRLNLPEGETLSQESLMMSEPVCFSTKHRTQIYETMFEKYGFGRIQSGNQGVLSLYSVGLTTGVAIDCGEGMTHCTPVYDGYSIPKANKRVDIGGRNITEFLIRLLQRRGYGFNRSCDFDLVRKIKEKFCYAAVDFELEKTLANETTVLEKGMILPDGSTIFVGRERFEATEALFRPSLVGYECEGLSTQLWSCIQACDIDVRKSLYEHVVLSGGSTMFPGLPTRIEKDMTANFLQHALRGDKSRLSKFKLSIEDPPRRKHMVFLGAAVMAKLSENIPESWMTRKQWAEEGPSALAVRYANM